MKVIVIYTGSFINCPPAISVVNVLIDLGYSVSIISGNPEDKEYFRETDVEIVVPKEKLYAFPKNILRWLTRFIYTKKFLKNSIDIISKNEENYLLWLISEKPLKYLGKHLNNYKYVLQFLELGQYFYYSSYLPFQFKIDKYLALASAITQCEDNRASIFQAWWGLKEKPYVLPNKMYPQNILERNTYIHDDIARSIIEKLKGKKIILYQGILNKDRPIENYIHAIDKMGENYAFVVMSNYPNIYSNINSCNYFYIPFVKPPYHLEITSHAYIGILTYVPYKNEYSPLNYIYCAPNKIWEYSQLSVPMIGNDIPGLKNPFEINKCGVCSKSLEIDDIIASIQIIEDNYTEYSQNAKSLYDSLDIKSIINEILEGIPKRC